MKQLPLPAHPIFPSRLDSIAALPELLRSRQIGCVLVIGDAHAVDCESLLLPVLEDSQIMYAVHAAVSLSDSKDGALTRTGSNTSPVSANTADASAAAGRRISGIARHCSNVSACPFVCRRASSA